MLLMIGALLPTGLLAAFFHWVFRKLRRQVHGVVVHGLSWITCSALWVFGSADGASLWTLDRFVNGLTLYFVPQAVWFLVEVFRNSRVTATGPLLVDDKVPTTNPNLSIRQKYSLWAGHLHGGQLVMTISLAVPIALAMILFGVLESSSATDAKKRLSDGDYVGSVSNIELSGVNFRASEHMDPAYVTRLRNFTDSLKAAGQSDYDIEEIVRQAKLPLTRSYFTERQSELQRRVSREPLGWLFVLIGCLVIVFSLATMWFWFGARGRRATSMATQQPN